MKGSTFVALDFETANHSRDSACAVGVVRVENFQIVQQAVHLIRPPSPEFVFTYIHGISWDDVKEAPTFNQVWQEIYPHFEGVDFIAAHNAGFDKGVLKGCCQTYGIEPPAIPFTCTVTLARKTWQLYPTKLSDVCRFLKIDLNHHEALSDARACAQIVIASQRALENKSRPSESLSPPK